VEVAQRSGVKASSSILRRISIRNGSKACTGRTTAGASAPECSVEQVSNRLAEIGFTDQRDLDLIREDVRFTLPPEWRRSPPHPPLGGVDEGAGR